jgi:hypothetical protein
MKGPETIDARCNHTTVSLKEYFDSMLNALEKRIAAGNADAKEAVRTAMQANEKRLDLLNEFRGQAEDQSRKYITTEMHDVLQKEVNANSTQIARLYGGLMVVAMVGIANLVKLFFAH